MSGRSATRLIDDPRSVTLAVVALVAAGLWLALWQSMAGMGVDMPAGGMAGMPGMTGSASPVTPGMSDAAPRASQSMSGMNVDAAAAMPGAPDMAVGASAVMPGMGAPHPDWSVALVASTAALWLLMMAAMMLPAMAPMMATYAGLAAKEDRGATLALRVGLFALGYFLLWALFSLAAALGQLGLRESAYFTMGGTLATPVAAGLLLLVAGAYQFTPLKDLCLRHCRHPLHFLMLHWREGLRGAFPVGARHGLYCFGCCIAFMGLMFVFGAMNVLWMAAIAAYFLAEKVLPRERLWGRATGALLLASGAAVLIREVL